MATNDIQGLPEGAVLKPIASASQPAVDTSQIEGLPAGATLKPITSDTVASSAPALSRSAEANQVAFHTPFVPEPVAPPQDHKEELVKNIAGDRGLTSYRAAREAVMHVENLIKAPAGAYDAAKQYVQSIPDTIKKAVMPEPQDLDPTHHEFRAAPITPIPGVGSAAEAFGAPVARAEAAAAATAPATEGLTTRLTNPFRKLLTSPKEAGVTASQEPAATAIRTAASTPAGTPILEGTTTAADDTLAKVGAAKDAAYKRIDDTVGFDLKAERQKLGDTQYAIKQPGADVPKLQQEIDASTKQIADANAKLKSAGIDPKVADRLNTSWEANKQFKNDLVKSTASDGTVNVKQLLNRSKNARFNPRYGDRLAQAFGKGDAAAGKPIADAYIEGLEAAQKAGVSAVKAQKIKLWVAGLVGAAAIGSGATAGIKMLLEP